MFYGNELSLFEIPKLGTGRPNRPASPPSSNERAWLQKYSEALACIGNDPLAWYFQAAVRRECAMSWYERDEDPGASTNQKKLDKLERLIHETPVVTLRAIKDSSLSVKDFRELVWFYDSARDEPISSFAPITKADLAEMLFGAPFLTDEEREHPGEVWRSLEYSFVRIRKHAPRDLQHRDLDIYLHQKEHPRALKLAELKRLGVLPYIDLLFWECRNRRFLTPELRGELVQYALTGKMQKATSINVRSAAHQNAAAFMDLHGRSARWLIEVARRKLIARWKSTRGKGDNMFLDYRGRYLARKIDWEEQARDLIWPPQKTAIVQVR